MKIMIAAIDRNGVIGRSKKPCPDHAQTVVVGRDESTIHAQHAEGCRCGGTGFVPCNELPRERRQGATHKLTFTRWVRR